MLYVLLDDAVLALCTAFSSQVSQGLFVYRHSVDYFSTQLAQSLI
ncbi:hypothetical protein [Rubritalea tangerina]